MPGWPRHTDDEVRVFHPAFAGIADGVLVDLGVAGRYAWAHHPRSLGSGTVPDYVLIDSISGEWILIVELKRTVAAVLSARFQSQAKGYADFNQSRFRPGRPSYFAISNLELTALCAVNGTRPPTECVVEHGIIRSGAFLEDSEVDHKRQFRADLRTVVERVLQTQRESFDLVWPPIIAEWLQHADTVAAVVAPGPPPPSTAHWDEVNAFFGQPEPIAAARVTLLQALLAAYLRGRLTATNHPRAVTVPPLNDRAQVARAVDALLAIDFAGIFDGGASTRFRSPTRDVRPSLDAYVAALSAQSPDVAALAERRYDHEELLEQAILATYPPEARAGAGKVQTDPELAAVLATLTIDAPRQVIDPCCGDGPLLVAALERLTQLGVTRADAIAALAGIEADPVLCRIATARLVTRAAGSLGPSAEPRIEHGDMFASAPQLRAAGAVLMNPPFRRYEDQGGAQVPAAVLRHYSDAIEQESGRPPTTLDKQPNLFHYYVEYITSVIPLGTRVGFVLDNKWHHNRTGRTLRQLILGNYRVLGLVEYPYRYFFLGWDIATSLLIAERDDRPSAAHQVRFIRTSGDPRQADLEALSSAMHGGGPWPYEWRANTVAQGDLDPDVGWKTRFASALPFDLAAMGLTPLDELFARSRRGALEKEGGGTQAFAMPFTRGRFGSHVGKSTRSGFTTAKLRELTAGENARLVRAADAIPARFRGRALKNSDNVSSYELSRADVERDQTLEPPALRRAPTLFTSSSRTPWTPTHVAAVREIRADRAAGAYLAAVEQIIGLTSSVLPDEMRFVDLREPFAGELIIPRKTRSGHRVHVNPFALDEDEQQLRISSNFVAYGGCHAVDPDGGLDRRGAVAVIAAFLVSSFGQLQFEEDGVNREGMLAVEKAGMDQILVPDPRGIVASRRDAIIREFARLPFPVPTNLMSASQPRIVLDRHFAEELAPRVGVPVDDLLQAVHDAVDEWITARQP